jgi:hypothetical protein
LFNKINATIIRTIKIKIATPIIIYLVVFEDAVEGGVVVVVELVEDGVEGGVVVDAELVEDGVEGCEGGVLPVEPVVFLSHVPFTVINLVSKNSIVF